MYVIAMIIWLTVGSWQMMFLILVDCDACVGRRCGEWWVRRWRRWMWRERRHRQIHTASTCAVWLDIEKTVKVHPPLSYWTSNWSQSSESRAFDTPRYQALTLDVPTTSFVHGIDWKKCYFHCSWVICCGMIWVWDGCCCLLIHPNS